MGDGVIASFDQSGLCALQPFANYNLYVKFLPSYEKRKNGSGQTTSKVGTLLIVF